MVISLRTSSANGESVARRLRTRGSEDKLTRQVSAFLVFAYIYITLGEFVIGQ